MISEINRIILYYYCCRNLEATTHSNMYQYSFCNTHFYCSVCFEEIDMSLFVTIPSCINMSTFSVWELFNTYNMVFLKHTSSIWFLNRNFKKGIYHNWFEWKHALATTELEIIWRAIKIGSIRNLWNLSAINTVVTGKILHSSSIRNAPCLFWSINSSIRNTTMTYQQG